MTDKWTVVQHSGYGYKRNPQFEHAVESIGLSNATEVRQVERAGGVVFDSYRMAEEFAERANYPADYNGGIIPDARGTFSDRMIEGLKIYIPVRAEPVG
jgi:3-mercaptopyruvate sulfurtransferase SseA